MSSKCKLRSPESNHRLKTYDRRPISSKCQGRRGCTCIKSPAKNGPVYAGVRAAVPSNTTTSTDSADPTLTEARAAPRQAHSPPQDGQIAAQHARAPASTASTTRKSTRSNVANQTSAAAAPEPPCATASPAATDAPPSNSATAPSTDEATASVDDDGAAAPAATDHLSPVGQPGGEASTNPPQTGTTTLRYNHYVHDVTVTAPPGTIKVSEVDELFSLSYGFKGNYTIHLRGPGPKGAILTRTDDTITGLILGEEFWCEVDEDPEEALKEKVTYKASGGDGFVKTSEDANAGEDNARCSCIEGNPCAVAYNCKDWANRFDVAKANGWKGF